MVCTVLHAQSSKIAFYKISLIKKFSLSLSLSVLQNRLNVDAMIMLSQEPNAIRTYSAQNPIFFKDKTKFG